MTAEQTLLQEIEESKRWIGTQKEESTYKRDLKIRIELINWVLENMENPNINICAFIETEMNNIIDKINEMDSMTESDPLDSEVRILDWILYLVSRNE